jgi:tetratricopeptide (TPR) repeat protein
MKLSTTQALQQAVIAHQNGELTSAELIYRAILNSPKDIPAATRDVDVTATAYNNLGFIQQQQGDLESAICNYRQAARINSKYSEAHNNLGYALQLSGAVNAAIASYRRAIKINPAFVEAYHNLGQALRVVGSLKDSADCYQKIVGMQPDNADAHNALGAALQLKGNLEAAIQSFETAVRLDPEFSEAYNNLGGAQQAKGDPDAAIESCRRAIELRPDYANAYHNLGHALSSAGLANEAIEAYQQVLILQPDSLQAYNSLGNILRKEGRFEEALYFFDALNQPKFQNILESNPSENNFWQNTKSQALECLYILGRYDELQERLALLAEKGDCNRRVSAVSAFVNHQLKTEDLHPFCTNPIDFVHIGSLSEHVTDVSGFTERLIEEAIQEIQVWEPEHGVTHYGYQTPNTIFEAGENCVHLEKILRDEISSYVARLRSVDCAYIKSWPDEFTLMGWHVRLVKSGYQKSHLHPPGWMSGVVYLQTLDTDNYEGAIEFSLHGYDLPILDSNIPKRVHRPEKGDIALFPSSLFHRTIPFTEDAERCVIAFNLVPVLYKATI